MHVACVGLPLGYEEVFMQASCMGTDPAAQQAAGTGEEFTQEEAVDDVEEMLSDAKRTFKREGICCCSGILSRHWSNWRILATISTPISTMAARNSRKIPTKR